mmetsp:Transcript_14060/g.13878  ORF Transcript_14060/g.13878 Transcript_14060/m.13878 type:complete len:100 (-) Transcript_14060:324-623(-)
MSVCVLYSERRMETQMTSLSKGDTMTSLSKPMWLKLSPIPLPTKLDHKGTAHCCATLVMIAIFFFLIFLVGNFRESRGRREGRSDTTTVAVVDANDDEL